MKLDILAFGSHPDDVEMGCAGTIIKEIELGKKVGIIDLTLGELGTLGTVAIRKAEATEAAAKMGVLVRENLEMRDGFFVNDEKHQLEVIKMIRKYSPEVVICNSVDDRHIDHPKGSKLVSDSCFLSGLKKIETVLDNTKQDSWRPKVVYHYIQWKNITPDFVVDITGYENKKMEVIMSYKSQFYNPKTNEPKTPINTLNFLNSLRYRSEDLGRLINKDSAEGFTVERLVAVNNLADLI